MGYADAARGGAYYRLVGARLAGAAGAEPSLCFAPVGARVACIALVVMCAACVSLLRISPVLSKWHRDGVQQEGKG